MHSNVWCNKIVYAPVFTILTWTLYYKNNCKMNVILYDTKIFFLR